MNLVEFDKFKRFVNFRIPYTPIISVGKKKKYFSRVEKVTPKFERTPVIIFKGHDQRKKAEYSPNPSAPPSLQILGKSTKDLS